MWFRLEQFLKRSSRTVKRRMGASDTKSVRQMDARQSGWFLDEHRQICPGFCIEPSDIVVDVGCGDGGLSEFAARCGAAVIATDVDPEKVALTERRLRRSPAREFRTIASDSNPLPLPDACATKIICREVLEHVDDPRQLMSELVRIGQSYAQYLITVPDPLGESVQRVVAPQVYWERPNHLRVFDRHEFDQLVTRSGLQLERRNSCDFYWTIWWILFWASGQEFGEREKPLLRNWTRTWHELISSPDGVRIKQALDEFMPKSQVVIARKAA